MNLLAIDTSHDILSVALKLNQEVRKEEQRSERAHNQVVLVVIDRLMRAAGLGVNALDGVAFSQGPGSFTGLRIAAAVAQGIAFGVDTPVIPVSCLAAIAQKQSADRVIPAVDAKQSSLYWGRYIRNSQGFMALDGEEHRTAVTELAVTTDDWVGAGSGWDRYSGEILAANHQSAIGWVRRQLPHALEIAVLGEHSLAKGLGKDAWHAIPNYHMPYFQKKLHSVSR